MLQEVLRVCVFNPTQSVSLAEKCGASILLWLQDGEAAYWQSVVLQLFGVASWLFGSFVEYEPSLAT